MADETWTNARGGGKARVIERARGLHPCLRSSVRIGGGQTQERTLTEIIVQEPARASLHL